MQRRSLLVVLAAVVIASVIVGTIALSDTIYTWEKTFEVKKPEIECEIEVGDHRIVGCPVKVWVCLKLEDCCWEKWEDDCDDHEECWECGCGVNGTYSVHLYWYNETSEEWQHVTHLQEETEIVLECHKKTYTYMFVPQWEGEYKVVVTFAVDSATYNFTSEE